MQGTTDPTPSTLSLVCRLCAFVDESPAPSDGAASQRAGVIHKVGTAVDPLGGTFTASVVRTA